MVTIFSAPSPFKEHPRVGLPCYCPYVLLFPRHQSSNAAARMPPIEFGAQHLLATQLGFSFLRPTDVALRRFVVKETGRHQNAKKEGEEYLQKKKNILCP